MSLRSPATMVVADTRSRCPLCGSTDCRFLGTRTDGVSVVRCDSCSLLRVNPVPNPHAVRAFYTKDYFEQEIYQGRYGETHGQPHQVPPVWSKILREIKRWHPRGRLLDIGCAHGFFLRAAAGQKFEPYGVELVSEFAVDARSLGYPVHWGDLRSAQFPDDFFDVVTMLDVIEHLRDPVAEVKEVARILGPRGLVALLTPNARQAGALGMRWRGFCHNFDHLWFFDPGTIVRLLHRAGFEVVRMFTSQPNVTARWVKRVSTSLKVDYLSVAPEARHSAWKKAVRKTWNALNRAAFWVPEGLLFGYTLVVLARVLKHEASVGEQKAARTAAREPAGR